AAVLEVAPEHCRRDMCERGDARGGLGETLLGVDSRLDDVLQRLRLAQQPRDDRLGELEMELEAVHRITPAERLLLVHRRSRQVGSVRWQLVRVAMEVENGERVVQAYEESIVATVVGELHRAPADLAVLAGIDAGPEDLRDQLRAETDAEDRTSGGDGLLDQGALGLQERMALGLVRPHRAAEHDDPADGANVLRQGVAARDV